MLSVAGRNHTRETLCNAGHMRDLLEQAIAAQALPPDDLSARRQPNP
jgi:hypothetical protein